MISTIKVLVNEAGLTIAEILIALAINSIIVLAMVSVVSNAMMSGKTSSTRQELATDFGLLQNYFARTIPNAGGMAIPTEAAFWVENSCSQRSPISVFKDCAQSDRLTVAASDEAPACMIVTWNAVAKTAVLNSSAGVCCLTARPLLHNNVLFINGYDYRQLYVTASDDVACTASFDLGPMAGNDNAGAATYSWIGGSVIPVHIDTFYLDVTNNTFNRYSYADAGTGVDDGKVQILADRVLDFQVALGYDFHPSDGKVDDNDDNTDEWLYNSPGESILMAPFAVPERKNTLRLLAIGWIIGAPGAGKTGATQTSVLDGPVRSKAGWTLQGGVAKLGARSVYVFD